MKDITTEAVKIECQKRSVAQQCFYFHHKNTYIRDGCRRQHSSSHSDYDRDLLQSLGIKDKPEFAEMLAMLFKDPATLDNDSMTVYAELTAESMHLKTDIKRLRGDIAKNVRIAFRTAALHLYLCYVCACQLETPPDDPDKYNAWNRHRNEYNGLTVREKERCLHHLQHLPQLAQNLKLLEYAHVKSLLKNAADTSRGSKVQYVITAHDDNENNRKNKLRNSTTADFYGDNSLRKRTKNAPDEPNYAEAPTRRKRRKTTKAKRNKSEDGEDEGDSEVDGEEDGEEDDEESGVEDEKKEGKKSGGRC